MPAQIGIGSQLAGYRVDDVVGRGGMGVVYRATELALERTVALKLIAPELAEDERFRERFLRESRLAASIEHPSILPIHAAGEADGAFFIAMRYVEGADIRALLAREGPLEPARALAVLEPIADALDSAHELGLVHRDVKPANVLVDRGGHAYLCDFGLTKQVSSISGLTATGQIVGTLDYLAPEQIRGDAVDGRADQYSLACLLWECLSGEPPLKRESDAQTLWAHMHEEPPHLPHARTDAALRRGLSKDPARRYASCLELVAAVRAAVLPATPAARRRRNLAWPAIAAGIVLAAAGALAFVLGRGGGGTPAARPVPVTVEPGSVAVIDARTARLVGDVQLPDGASGIVVGGGAAWVATRRDETLTRIDLRQLSAGRTVGLGLAPSGLAVGGGGVWAIDGDARLLRKVDARYFTLGAPVSLPATGRPGALTGIAVGYGAVWIVDSAGRLTRVDPRRPQRRRVFQIGGRFTDVALGEGSVWLASEDPPGVVRVDPRSGQLLLRIPVALRTTAFSPIPQSVAVGPADVWVANGNVSTLNRIDSQTGAVVTTLRLALNMTRVVIGAGRVWIADEAYGTVFLVDPATNRVARRIELGAAIEPTDIAFGGGRVWVSTAPSP